MSLTIDDKIDMPVDTIVYWVTRLMGRTRQMDVLTNEERQSILDMHPEFFDVESQLMQVYSAVIRQRDGEFHEYSKFQGMEVSPLLLQVAPLTSIAALGNFMGIE